MRTIPIIISFVWLLSVGCLHAEPVFAPDLALDEGVEVFAPEGSSDVHVDDSPLDDWITRSRRTETSARDASPNPTRSILALLVILGGLLGVRYIIRRKGLAGVCPHTTRLLRMVTRLRVGPRQDLVVVDFHGKHLLLGVTPENIHVLTESAQGVLAASDRIAPAADTGGQSDAV